jgi:hypothetical protein
MGEWTDLQATRLNYIPCPGFCTIILLLLNILTEFESEPVGHGSKSAFPSNLKPVVTYRTALQRLIPGDTQYLMEESNWFFSSAQRGSRNLQLDDALAGRTIM